MIKCLYCKSIKTESEFSKNKSSNRGYQNYCKICFKLLVNTKYKDTIRNYRIRYNSRPEVKSKSIKMVNKYNKTRDGGLFKKYLNAYSRCNYKSNDRYKWYGGRGIRFIWINYHDFKNDMQQSFYEHVKNYGLKNTTLDRINPYGNYCKENCRWLTHSEQHRNTRATLRNTKKTV